MRHLERTMRVSQLPTIRLPVGLARVAVIATTAILCGCSNSGPAKGTATGTVTLNGRPVTQGSVVFQNAEAGVSQMVPLGADGSFEMRSYEGPGIPVGSYKVIITPRTMSQGEQPLAEAPTPDQPPPQSEIPAKYQDAATTPLTAEVRKGINPSFDFALQQ
jgi:hypothetical protein